MNEGATRALVLENLNGRYAITMICKVQVDDPAAMLGGRGVHLIELIFEEDLHENAKQHIADVVEYWAEPQFVTRTPIELKWTPRKLEVWVNTGSTASKDIVKRQIIEMLLHYLVEGTPTRKTHGGSRAIPGCLQVPAVVIVS